MSALPVDQAARDLVSRDGLDQTLFVEAGAGSGKTRQLVERIANLVMSGQALLGGIAAITFTEAAASELQSRIREELELRAADETLSGDARRRCADAIGELDLAAISTLHGFASRLLSEFSTAAGLPPRIGVLDEVSSQLAHEERWGRFVDELYANPDNDAVLVRAALLGIVLEQRYSGQTTMKDVAVELAQNWDRLDMLVDTDPPVIGDLDFSDVDAAMTRVCGLLQHCTDPSDLFAEHLAVELIPQMSRLMTITDPARKLAELSSITPWKLGRGGKNGAWGGDVKQFKALVVDANDAAATLRSAAVDDVLRHLLILVAREVAAAAQARRRAGGLEFHDLLVIARETLRTDAATRSVLHARYTHVLLDEFQDTDPIQIDVALLIAATIDADHPPAWHELVVEPGRLFFVGDPKQSIYRFRRADIELFLAARDRFGSGSPVHKLTTNFRTVAPILDWVNALFDDQMPVELAGRQPRYEPLSAWRSASPGADHRPLLLGGPHPDPSVKAGDLRAAEALDVATTIADVRARPDRWPVLDPRSGSWRPASLSDVTILIPTRTSLPYLRSALDALDLPYRLATGTLVYDTQEVRDCLAALRAIDDPTDSLSLVTALRSPYYACSDVDLFSYRQAGGEWDVRHPPATALPLDHPVCAALTHLHTLWSERWWSSPSTLLDRLLVERQAMLLAFGDQRYAEVWRRLRFLVDQARAFEESGGAGLRDFLDWTELQSADGARVHEPLLPETDDDAARIMTIHGAKGLEFPITILSGMTTRSNSARRGVSVLWGDVGPPEVRLRKDTATARHEPRADLELEMDAHEKLRLLYVAATRARDHLVVSCHHKVGSKATDTYAGRVWTYFSEREDLSRYRAATPSHHDRSPETASGSTPTATTSAPPHDDRAGWIDARARLVDPQRTPRVVSATAVARGSSPAAAEGTSPPRRQGRAGSAIGRAVHATLQVLDLSAPRDLDLQVRRQCDLESIPEHVDLVAGLVRSAVQSETVIAAGRGRHHKEVYVVAPIGDRVLEGYIDLLIETDDGLIVVDYKTDSARSAAEIDAKVAEYQPQGAAYALALEHATGLRVVACRFIFCRLGGAIERSVADLPAAMRRAALTMSATSTH